MEYDQEAFSVTAPGPLAATTQTTSTGAGSITTRMHAFMDQRGVQFFVTCLDFPFPVPDQRALDWSALLDARVEPSAIEPVRVGGRDARQSLLRFSDGRTGVVRDLWVGDSAYLYGVIAPAAVEARGEAEAFLASFWPGAGWRSRRIEAGRFEIEVPREARYDVSTDGDTTLHRFVVGDREVCRVFDTLAEGVKPAGLEITHQTVVSTLAAGLKVLGDEAVVQDGQSGRELHLVRPSGEHEAMRLFVGDDHVYLASAVAGAPGTLEPGPRRCLNSFRPMVSVPAPAPPAE